VTPGPPPVKVLDTGTGCPDAGRVTTAPSAPRRLTATFWRTRRSAAVAGIVFAVLLLTAMTMMRLALAEDSLATLHSDAASRRLVGWALSLVPFAGIAFLWFIRAGAMPRWVCHLGYVSALVPLAAAGERTWT